MCSVTQLCPIFCDLVDCHPTGSSVHGSPGKNAGVGCHFLLWGIFPTQGSNLCLLCLLHWKEFFTWSGFFITSATWKAHLCNKVNVQIFLVSLNEPDCIISNGVCVLCVCVCVCYAQGKVREEKINKHNHLLCNVHHCYSFCLISSANHI